MCLASRYVVIILCSLGMCLLHAQRVNVAVTVVTILDEAPHKKVGTLEAMMSCTSHDVYWDAPMIGWLHSVFFVGYLLTQVPGGFLTTKFPANRLFGGAIILSCVLNLMLPLCIDHLGYAFTCAVRFLQGLSEGLVFPASYAMLRYWATPEESSCMGATVLTGVYTGAVIGYPLSGFLTHYIGWQYVYYIHGAMGILWGLSWLLIVYEKPADHPRISDEELKLIHSRQGITAIKYEDETVPWVQILTSLPVHALNVCNFARSFVFFLLLTNEAVYLNVFGYNLAENGLYSSLPHLLMACIAAASGPMADLMIGDKFITRTHVRKIFTAFGFGTECLCFVGLGFATNGTFALLLLTVGVGISGLTISGWQVNHLDIAPRYASILVALSTSCGNIAGILVPVIIGHITVDQTVESWHNVFFLTAAILLFGVIFFSVFGSGERQPWADPKPAEKLVPNMDTVGSKPFMMKPIALQTVSEYGSTKDVPHTETTTVQQQNQTATQPDVAEDVIPPSNKSALGTEGTELHSRHNDK